MSSGIVLLPNEVRVAVKLFDSRKEAIFEDVDVGLAVDVAKYDEWTNKTTPTHSSIYMECSWVSIDPGTLDIVNIDCPLTIVSSVDFELTRDHGRVSTDDSLAPKHRWFALNELAVRLAILEVFRLERYSSSSDKESISMFNEVSFDGGL